jgi:hypothetical protein
VVAAALTKRTRPSSRSQAGTYPQPAEFSALGQRSRSLIRTDPPSFSGSRTSNIRLLWGLGSGLALQHRPRAKTRTLPADTPLPTRRGRRWCFPLFFPDPPYAVASRRAVLFGVGLGRFTARVARADVAHVHWCPAHLWRCDPCLRHRLGGSRWRRWSSWRSTCSSSSCGCWGRASRDAWASPTSRAPPARGSLVTFPVTYGRLRAPRSLVRETRKPRVCGASHWSG